MTTFDFGWGDVPAHRHSNGGGWVADSATVAETAYIGPSAQVFGKAQVFGEAQVFDKAQVFGKAWVYGKAQVYGEALVSGKALVYGEALVSGEARVSGEAWIFTTTDYLCVGPLGSRNSYITVTKTPALQFCTGCFCGDLDSFKAAVTKQHGDNTHAQMYRAVITFARAWAGIDKEG